MYFNKCTFQNLTFSFFSDRYVQLTFKQSFENEILGRKDSDLYAQLHTLWLTRKIKCTVLSLSADL